MQDSHTTVAPVRHLGFQYETLEQQRLSSTFGMWIFLATEILFFGGLFTAYLVYRNTYPAAWSEASAEMKFWFGTINTGILLCSSLTMAMAVYSAQTDRRRLLVLFLLATLVLGMGFLVLKGFEYHAEWVEHHVPGPNFEMPKGATDPRHSEIFFGLYFTMTGLHAVHMTVGLLIGAIILYLAWRGEYGPLYHTPVENFGLYWHFVDVIWIFLYPLLYLVGSGKVHHG